MFLTTVSAVYEVSRASISTTFISTDISLWTRQFLSLVARATDVDERQLRLQLVPLIQPNTTSPGSDVNNSSPGRRLAAAQIPATFATNESSSCNNSTELSRLEVLFETTSEDAATGFGLAFSEAIDELTASDSHLHLGRRCKNITFVTVLGAEASTGPQHTSTGAVAPPGTPLPRSPPPPSAPRPHSPQAILADLTATEQRDTGATLIGVIGVVLAVGITCAVWQCRTYLARRAPEFSNVVPGNSVRKSALVVLATTRDAAINQGATDADRLQRASEIRASNTESIASQPTQDDEDAKQTIKMPVIPEAVCPSPRSPFYSATPHAKHALPKLHKPLRPAPRLPAPPRPAPICPSTPSMIGAAHAIRCTSRLRLLPTPTNPAPILSPKHKLAGAGHAICGATRAARFGSLNVPKTPAPVLPSGRTFMEVGHEVLLASRLGALPVRGPAQNRPLKRTCGMATPTARNATRVSASSTIQVPSTAAQILPHHCPSRMEIPVHRPPERNQPYCVPRQRLKCLRCAPTPTNQQTPDVLRPERTRQPTAREVAEVGRQAAAQVRRRCMYVRLDVIKRRILLLGPIEFHGSKHKEGVAAYKHPERAENIIWECMLALQICNDLLFAKKLSPFGIVVEGHTSLSIHGEEKSVTISQSRAKRCAESLVRHLKAAPWAARPDHGTTDPDIIWGVHVTELISSTGHGASKPLPGFDDGGNYEQNRRVEMRLCTMPRTPSSDARRTPCVVADLTAGHAPCNSIASKRAARADITALGLTDLNDSSTPVHASMRQPMSSLCDHSLTAGSAAPEQSTATCALVPKARLTSCQRRAPTLRSLDGVGDKPSNLRATTSTSPITGAVPGTPRVLEELELQGGFHGGGGIRVEVTSLCAFHVIESK